MDAGKRGVSIKIAQNDVDGGWPEATYLSQIGVAEVRSLNFSRLIGSGILHTKSIVVDRQHFYVGSANMDWRSLTQVTFSWGSLNFRSEKWARLFSIVRV